MRRLVLATAMAVAAVGACLAGASGAAFADSHSGHQIQVQVTSTGSSLTWTATASVAATSQATSASGTSTDSGSSTSSGSSFSGSSSADTTSASPATTAQVLGEGSIPSPSSGSTKPTTGLGVSGLLTHYSPALNPGQGDVQAQVSIRNGTGTAVSPTVAFSVTNVFGHTLDVVPARSTGPILPGAMAVAEADLGNIGQWGVVDVHATINESTPAAGSTTTITRDHWMLVPPWFSLGLVGIGAVVVGLWFWAGRAARATVAAAGVA